MLVFLKCCGKPVAELRWGNGNAFLAPRAFLSAVREFTVLSFPSGVYCLPFGRRQSLVTGLPLLDHRTHDINKSFKVMLIIVGMNGGSDSAVSAR